MLQVSQLFIYPVKSLGGIAVERAQLTDRGLEHDRRWMLIDENNRFISQRNHAAMALFKLQAAENGFLITYQPDGSSCLIKYEPAPGAELTVSVWDDTCTALLVDHEVDEWFSAKLNMRCRMAYMPNDACRPVDHQYAKQQEVVSFADAYPVLLIGQGSMDELNARLEAPVSIDRFRPNIVFTGAEAHYEDRMAHFTINGIEFFGVKPCARCQMIGIDQQTAREYKEPTKTLARYRFKNNKIYFGQNLLHKGEGTLQVGDQIDLLRIKPDFMLMPGKVNFYEML